MRNQHLTRGIRTACLAVVAVVASLGNAQANDIFSNFDVSEANCSGGLQVHLNHSKAVSFTPTADAVINEIQLRITSQTIFTNVTIDVRASDGGGKPGTTLETLHDGLLSIACPGLLTVSSSGLAVEAGETYWVVCEADGPEPTLWHFNTTGALGIADEFNGNWILNPNATSMALNVTAVTPVSRWHLDNAVFHDGGTATGSFVFDDPSDSYSDIQMSTTAGTSFGGAEYTELVPGNPGDAFSLWTVTNASAGDLSGEDVLYCRWADELEDDRSSADLNVSPQAQGEGQCATANCSGLGVARWFVSGRVIQLGNRWSNKGNGLAGTDGVPLLVAEGQLCPGEDTILELSHAKDNASAYYVIGLTEISAAFKQGVLVPSPDLIIPLASDGNGELTVSYPWPAGIPGGLSAFHQFWVQDGASPSGYSASNALESVTP